MSYLAGIRLAGSSTANEGRVEIFKQGTWGTICDDKFDMIDASVVCKELGYAGASTKTVNVNEDANPSMKIHINELECDPGDYFWYCSHNNADRPICNHDEDVKVSCSSGTEKQESRGIVFLSYEPVLMGVFLVHSKDCE